MIFLLAACGGATSAAVPTPTRKVTAKAIPINLLTPGYLTVGNYTNYPPQEYFDPTTHNPVGFDIDLVQALASRMGLRVKIVSMEFHDLIQSLTAKDLDIVVSAISMTSSLQGKVDFVPYLSGGESLMVLKGNPHMLNTVADLCGQAVGVRSGTIEESDLHIASDDCKARGKQPVALVTLDSQDAVTQLLLTKRVVATYQDSPVTDYAVQQSGGRAEAVTPIVNANPEGIAVRPDNTGLFNAVQAAFRKLQADQTYHRLIEKWGLINEELAPAVSHETAGAARRL
jgi:polar amino acid transport system substrate-binding protein